MASLDKEELAITVEEMRMARIIRTTMLDDLMVSKLAKKLMPEINSAIQNNLTDIRNTQENMLTEIETLKEKLNGHEQLLDKKDQEIKSLQTEITKCKQGTKSQDENTADADQTINQTVESQVERILKQQESDSFRSKNIIIHGAKEDKEENIHKRIANEMETITEILKSLEVSTTVTGHTRLGKFNTENDRPRLLRVSLENEHDRNEVLQKSRKLIDILITPDRSHAERQRRKELRQELLERKGKGEINLAIKNNEIVTTTDTGAKGAGARAKDTFFKQPFRV